MKIHIDQIKPEGLALEFEEKSDNFPVFTEMTGEGECEFPSPIKTALRALRFGDIIEIQGNIKTSVRLICGRCLQWFETSLTPGFALTYKRLEPDTKKENKKKEIELNAKDIDLTYFQGEEINLRNGIQEQIVMAFPLSALCRKTCKGLCPQCGVDRNLEDCGCDHTPSAGRFAALKKLNFE